MSQGRELLASCLACIQTLSAGKCDGGISDFYAVPADVGQECILSLTRFNACMDWVLCWTMDHCSCWALLNNYKVSVGC